MRLDEFDTTYRFEGKVVSSERISPPETDEVREMVIDIQDGPKFEVGHNFGIIVPAESAFGSKDHFRLYSVADIPASAGNGTQRIVVAVKRVSYIDDYSGERYQGRASNYLCDLRSGDRLTITGPYGTPYKIPEENDANIVLIGMGTGIAPFRAYMKLLYATRPDFAGAVRLFYGARSGLELIYMNEERDDFAQYYDKGTFEAFKALSPRPHWSDPIAWDEAIGDRGMEIWTMLLDHKTYVFVAGMEEIRDHLDDVFAGIVDSREQWLRRKAELQAGGRWIELLY